MPKLFADLPWYARLALIVGGGLLSAFASRLPEAWQDAGLYLGFAIAFYGATASVWHIAKVNRKNAESPLLGITLRRQHFSIAGWLLAFAIISGMGGAAAYQKWFFVPPPPQIIRVTVPTITTSPQIPKTITPNAIERISPDVATRLGRYIQLMALIPQAQQIQRSLTSLGAQLRDSMKPSPSAKGKPPWEAWDVELSELRQINSTAYKDRPLDLQSVPELAIPTMKAPNESAFPDDQGERLYQYRSFHFLVVNILKQADALIADMQQEATILRTQIINTPWGGSVIKN